jgi:hypothetical protein
VQGRTAAPSYRSVASARTPRQLAGDTGGDQRHVAQRHGQRGVRRPTAADQWDAKRRTASAASATEPAPDESGPRSRVPSGGGARVHPHHGADRESGSIRHRRAHTFIICFQQLHLVCMIAGPDSRRCLRRWRRHYAKAKRRRVRPVPGRAAGPTTRAAYGPTVRAWILQS